jgi:serine palmitoyltransferase
MVGGGMRRKPLNRRFIVVEGIYMHSGDLAPLADIYRLKENYKCGPTP